MKVLPGGYPVEMENLLCALNPDKCRDGKISTYNPGDKFRTPDVYLREYSFNYPVPIIDGEKVPDDVVKRQVPQYAAMTNQEKDQYLEKVREENLFFKRPQILDGKKVVYLPKVGYYATVSIPGNRTLTKL